MSKIEGFESMFVVKLGEDLDSEFDCCLSIIYFNLFLESNECFYISDHQVRIVFIFKEQIILSREKEY